MFNRVQEGGISRLSGKRRPLWLLEQPACCIQRRPSESGGLGLQCLAALRNPESKKEPVQKKTCTSKTRTTVYYTTEQMGFLFKYCDNEPITTSFNITTGHREAFFLLYVGCLKNEVILCPILSVSNVWSMNETRPVYL